jgi:hypothetical protein
MDEREPHAESGFCGRCWSDAYLRTLATGRSQYECYMELLEEHFEELHEELRPDPEDSTTKEA